ncbi:MAG: hypothetical protein JSR77_02270 [Planctomycetes bacterium]|nr:hypothetical protein [Planctomycetota bacterium]
MRCIQQIVRGLIIVAGMYGAAEAQRSTPVQLLQTGASANDQFGDAVAVSGDTLVVGSPSDDVGPNTDQGSVHIYRWTGTGWAFEATLTAAGGAAGDFFGGSVAISGDTVVVGAFSDDVGANANQGSAYVFTRSGTTWTQQAQLNAAGGAAGDSFGGSVAISADTVVVGAYADDVGANANQGSAYVFARSGTAWTQQAQLNAVGGAATDFFGFSVAISGDTVAVGARLDDVGANVDQGSVVVFTRSGTSWTQQAQLIAAGGAGGDLFGQAIAISGETIVVGASGADVGVNSNQGSVYVFTRTGGVWSQQAQLINSDGATSDNLGGAVAIDADTVVVGAPGKDLGGAGNQGQAYVFTRSGAAWTQQQRFTVPDGAVSDVFGSAVAVFGDTFVAGAPADDVGLNTNQGSVWVFSRIGSVWIGPDFQGLATGGATGDQFGVSVAISGDTAIVGAFHDNVGLNLDQGSAYVFVRTGASWTQQAQFIAAGGGANDLFGFSVAISGDTAVVGAYHDDVGVNTDQGSAYVFVRSGATWTQQAQLFATGGAAGDEFGISVAISGDTALIGAHADDVGANAGQGSAYVFTRSGTTWTQQAQLIATGGAAGDAFGIAVALEDDTAVVGAWQDDVGTNNFEGSAVVFVRSGTAWSQQALLTAQDGAANDFFGNAVAISGDTVVVGDSNDVVGGNVAQGSATVFVRSGTVWSQRAKLVSSDGLQFDNLGVSVAVSTGPDGDIVVAGANFDDVSGAFDQGSAYVFTRLGDAWVQQSRLTLASGAAQDGFGVAVAMSGGALVVGANLDDVGANTDQGSVAFFDLAANDFVSVHNDVLDVSYPSLSAAFTPAQSGHQITATTAAWARIGTLNTLGRSLALLCGGDVRTPPGSVLTLTDSTYLSVPASSAIGIFGELRVQGYIDLYAGEFRVGSRGALTARTGSSLSVYSPVTNLEGPGRIEQNAAVRFAGDVTAIGPVTALANSSVDAGGTIRNIDAWTMTSAQVTAPVFENRSSLTIFGSSAVFGSFTNSAGATATIRGGTLYVFGTLTNNGTVVGTVCSNCLGGPPNLDVGGSLVLGPAANLLMPFTGSLVHIGGSFDCAINDNTRYHMSQATLQLEGTGAEQTLEVMSADIGADESGLDRTLSGHYPIGVLHIGPAISTVRLVDAHDNDGEGQASCEALYVETLRIEAGSRLINPSCRIYYRTLENSGTVDAPENLIPIGAPCFADFNQDGGIDGADVQAFFAAWEAGDFAADVNQDGGIDGSDVDTFFAAWEAGGC